MHSRGHKIKRVLPGGIAEEMGVEAGMSILKVNDVVPEDVFDYQYLMEDEYVTVLIREADGTETLLEIEKDPVFSVSSIRCRKGCGIRSILKMMTLVSAFCRVITLR